MQPGVLHRPVMLKEVLEWLGPRPGHIVVDCTLGTGGHASAILREIGPGGLLIGIDKDKEALEVARRYLSSVSNAFRLFHADYKELGLVLEEAQVEKVDGLLLDLGASSFQLGLPERGFSFQLEGPLDMRMDRSSNLTAEGLLRRLSEEELADLFERFGEERWSRRIARAIKREMKRTPLRTTTQLARIIEKAVPTRGRIHPATRVFQALRIAVNKELESLEGLLDSAHTYLKPGGRMVAISFHSLEDRRVKQAFREGSRQGLYRLLTKKPIRASQEEVRENVRSRGAKLRAVEKI